MENVNESKKDYVRKLVEQAYKDAKHVNNLRKLGFRPFVPYLMCMNEVSGCNHGKN